MEIPARFDGKTRKSFYEGVRYPVFSKRRPFMNDDFQVTGQYSDRAQYRTWDRHHDKTPGRQEMSPITKGGEFNRDSTAIVLFFSGSSSGGYFFMYALSPIVIGFPSTIAVVTAFPCVLATTSDFPEEEGVGASRSISMQSLPFLISTVMAMAVRSFSL